MNGSYWNTADSQVILTSTLIEMQERGFYRPIETLRYLAALTTNGLLRSKEGMSLGVSLQTPSIVFMSCWW